MMSSSNCTKKKTTKSSPNSAEQVASNEDLLTEILLRLPAKSLIKFKVVSKQWMFIISSTRFCLSHTCSPLPNSKATLKPSALFLNVYHFPPSEFRFLPLTHDCIRLPLFDFIDMPNITILQSCSGLLLCDSHDYSVESGLRYFICNPTTRQFKMLPFPSPQVDDYYEHVALNLALDPLKSPYYKIISVRKRKIDEPWQMAEKPKFCIDVYSSETNSWSLSKIKFTGNRCVQFDHGVFFKDAIHCYSNSRESLYFNVENECIKPIPMPMPEVDNKWCEYFGESGGYLKLAVAHMPAHLKFSVFEMVEDYSDWYLKYSLNFGAKMDSPSWLPFWTCYIFFEAYQLFCVIQSEEEGDTMYIVFLDGNAFSYNIRDDTLKGLLCPPIGKYAGNNFVHRASQFTETFFCI